MTRAVLHLLHFEGDIARSGLSDTASISSEAYEREWEE